VEVGVSDGPQTEATEACGDVSVAVTKVIPTVMVLIDQSGSMTTDFGGKTRWNAARDALMDPTTGIIHQLQAEVRFGLALYTNDGKGSCPDLTKVAIALNNYAAIQKVYGAAGPKGDTPTGESIQAILPDLAAVTEPGPKLIVLATDGEPDTCAVPNPQTGQPQAIAAAQAAYAQGVWTYVIGVGSDVGAAHLQNMANAGVGKPVNDPAPAPYFVANNPSQLYTAFQNIINGARSCVYNLNGTVQPGMESQGSVLLDGTPLGFNDSNGWKLNNPSQIELVGASCEAIQTGDHALTVTFPCDAVTVGPPR